MSAHTRKGLGGIEWFHDWEIEPGVWTGGTHRIEPGKRLDAMGFPADCAGLSVLDVGCWDGPLTHELARRRAKAVGMDIHNPNKTGFGYAKELMGSGAEYWRWDISRTIGSVSAFNFHVVLFLAVWHHLKNPLLALECINGVMKVGGKLHFEGLVNERTESVAEFRLGHGGYAGPCWVPSALCVIRWIECCGFEVDPSMFVAGDRMSGFAIKVGDPKPEFPEAVL